MKKKALLLILSASLWGCMSKDEQQAVDKITEIIHPDRVAVGSGISIGINKKELNLKTITLIGGDNLNNPDISDESITSIGALTFYQNLSPETLKNKNAIKITLERSINSAVKNVEAIYYIDTLSLVNQYMPDCQKIGQSFMKQNYDYVYSNLYSDIRSSASSTDFKSQLQQLDTKYGKTKSYMVTKFKTYSDLQNDGTKVPIVNYSIELSRDSINNVMDLKYSLRNDLKGILDLNL